jgi:hypothetical protein
VRIVRGPYMGKTGTVAGFAAHSMALPAGTTGRAVEVRLRSGESIFAPQANVELFG